MTRPTHRGIASAAWTLLALGGCATGASLHLEAETIQEQLNTAREAGAYVCAPRELATAEAHLEFLLSELDQGNPVRAAQHRTTAREALVTVLDKAKGCLPKDKDGDGIPDDVDKCPEVAEDFDGHDDEDGCPESEDTDGDGIFDPEDACPKEPGPAKNRGCPIGDRDGDGILDDNDKCPDDPEDKDEFEDEDGCPDPDNDADGILDVNDECPLEPETVNGVDDEDGCPDVKLNLVEVRRDIGKIEIKQKVYFETGKSVIRSVSFELLSEVAQAIKSNKGMNVLVEGHTDSVGSNTFNMGLSQRRADSVRDYLVAKGVEADRLTAIGFGEEKPIDSNQTRAGREKNRRVEFTITKQ